jgi:hypothetical protein
MCEITSRVLSLIFAQPGQAQPMWAELGPTQKNKK